MDEPRRHPGFLLLLFLVAFATVPLPFVGPDPAFLFGLPLWLWWSLGWTAALSALTVFGIRRYWRDDTEGPDSGAGE